MSSVLITGCSKGIGRAVALELARRGHRVVATARRPETLVDLPVAQRLALDVTDDASVRAAFEAAGQVDAVISNAGEIFLAPVEGTPLDELARLLELNTLGAVRVAQAALPAMRHRGSGRILFVSSVSGRAALPLQGGYAATKWAVEALAEALATEVRHFGVLVSLLEPGAVSSGALDAPRTYLDADDPYLPLARQLGTDPGSMISVEEVAAAAADALEDPNPPLRIPVGEPARRLLAARRSADDAVPFTPAPLRW